MGGFNRTLVVLKLGEAHSFRPREEKPTVGLEPTTYRLRGDCSTAELRRLFYSKEKGAGTQTRTGDTVIFSHVLYHLSYPGTLHQLSLYQRFLQSARP